MLTQAIVEFEIATNAFLENHGYESTEVSYKIKVASALL